MKKEVTEYKGYVLELYPKNDEDENYMFELTKEQFELVNQILVDTNARFINLNNKTFNVNAIRRVFEIPVRQISSPKLEEPTPEEREKAREACESLKKQLLNKNILRR